MKKAVMRKTMIWAVVIAALLALAAESLACPVCFGESDDPIIKGLESSILFMVGITYTLILGGVATFIFLRRRARRTADATAE